MLENIIIISLIFNYFYFIFRSPISQWFWNLFNSLKLQTKDKKTLWALSKLDYLLKCIFCVSGWTMIGITIYAFAKYDQNYLVYCLTCPFVSILFWQLHLFLKQPKTRQEKIKSIAQRIENGK